MKERRWHKSQRLDKENGGSLTLTLRVFDSDEIRSWIRSFGNRVEILEPKAVKGRAIGK
jgi:predicted DNA-binding transcriptional regulator YafY